MSNSGKYIKKLEESISESGNILLVCHVNPDGDAVGSMLALYSYLSDRGREVSMLSPNYLQEFLLWMTDADKIQIFLRNRKKAQKLIESANLIIFLDFNSPSRLGEAEKIITRATAKKIIIDHHVDPSDMADFIISEPSYCSTAELLHNLITGMNKGVAFSTPAYNEAIYVGIITDTGNFEHGSYTGDTLRIIADLIDSGVGKEKVFDRVYNNFSYERMRLQGFALHSRMKILDGYPVAYIWLTKEDLNQFKYSKGDTEGFVNMPLSIKGITVSALFVEKDGFIKVSLRSKGSFSVNDFAASYFNGGGHINAAGGEYYDSLEKSITYFEKTIFEVMSATQTNNN
ncbi:MAG: bifunctional oligoribonuclease/PAP phosphatase NrnA [Bacteroidales bacterium]|nr:bifunctional oligoribonuclease/PAP phosphatase NrnA [Bacteroidales bacterium]